MKSWESGAYPGLWWKLSGFSIQWFQNLCTYLIFQNEHASLSLSETLSQNTTVDNFQLEKCVIWHQQIGRGCFPGKSEWSVMTESSLKPSIFRISAPKSSVIFQIHTGSAPFLLFMITVTILHTGQLTAGYRCWFTWDRLSQPPNSSIFMKLQLAPIFFRSCHLKAPGFDIWYNFRHQETPDGCMEVCAIKMPFELFPPLG